MRAEDHLLMNGGNARLLCDPRRREHDGLASEPDYAIVRRVHAGQDVDERGLARSVVPHEDMDLPWEQVEIDLVEGERTGEPLGYRFSDEQGPQSASP
jgi:hypothetical protein